MENLILSVEVVLPLLIMMLVGVLLRWRNVIDSDGVKKITRITFFVSTPAMCFRSMLTANFDGATSAASLLYIVGMIVVSFVVLCLIVPRFEKVNARRGVLIQAMYRPNEAIFGIPIVTALCGENHLGLMMLAIAVSVPLFNLGGVLSLELFRDEKAHLGAIIKQIVTNPIIIGVVLGLLLNLTGVTLPPILMSPLNSIAGMCTPLAFIALGASLSFGSMRQNRVPISIATFVRLFLLPALSIGLMALAGYRGEVLIVTMVVFGAPTALSSFTLSAQLGGDTQLASEIIATTCMLSMFSMLLWIFLLKQTGLI